MTEIKMGNRGFEKVDDNFLVGKGKSEYIAMPRRATNRSAGYDFRMPYTGYLQAGQAILIPTNVKAYMLDDEYLDINIRSSLAIDHHLRLKNFVGIIDSDYYSNPKNDGNIFLCIVNEGDDTMPLEYGDKIAQGIFKKYLITDDDEPESEERVGGIGSTGK